MGKLLQQGEVAQLVEHATENRGVGSSILPLATILFALRPPCKGAGCAERRVGADTDAPVERP